MVKSLTLGVCEVEAAPPCGGGGVVVGGGGGRDSASRDSW